MIDNVLIPHDAIQAFANGDKQPMKLTRVQPLFTLKQACRILSMSADEMVGLLKSKRLFALVHK